MASVKSNTRIPVKAPGGVINLASACAIESAMLRDVTTEETNCRQPPDGPGESARDLLDSVIRGHMVDYHPPFHAVPPGATP